MKYQSARIGMVMAGLAAVCLMANPVQAYAERGHDKGDHHEKKEMMIKEIISELGLSQEQMTAVEQQRTQSQEKGKQLQEQLFEKKKALKEALKAETVDQGKIDQLITETSALHADKMRNWVDSVLHIRSILTPEQYSEFQKKMDERKAEWREKWKDKKDKEETVE